MLGIVILLDQPLTVGQDRLFVLDDFVGRQAAFGLADGETAPAEVETNAQLAGNFDLGVE